MKDFEEIYNLYFSDVYLFAKALTKDDYLAEEITQETFFKALKNLGKFKGECEIRIWLCQIAKNSFFSICRKNKKIFHDNLDSLEDFNQADFVETIIDTEDYRRINGILQKLNEPYRQVFSLRMFGELPFSKIGDYYKRSESWARVTYHRAKLIIIREMEEK